MKSLFQKPDLGLLILRLAIGILMLFSGISKFTAGAEMKEKLIWVGSQIQHIGIAVPESTVMPLFFGIMAASAEVFGGILLVVGWFFRPACILILFTMVVATMANRAAGGDEMVVFHAVGFTGILAIVSLAMLFTGPGRFSVQKD